MAETPDAITYPCPDVEALVWSAISGLGGMKSWAVATVDLSTPPGWLTAVTVQVDARASSKQEAYSRADEARRIVLQLPWTATAADAVVVSAALLEGPMWLADQDGAPRYVARYEVRVHPVASASSAVAAA